jgi:hypothetical protein
VARMGHAIPKPAAGKIVLAFRHCPGACMLWIGEPGSLVGPRAMPTERPGDRLGAFE